MAQTPHNGHCFAIMEKEILRIVEQDSDNRVLSNTLVDRNLYQNQCTTICYCGNYFAIGTRDGIVSMVERVTGKGIMVYENRGHDKINFLAYDPERCTLFVANKHTLVCIPLLE